MVKSKIYYKINGKLLKDKKGSTCSDTFKNKIIKVPEEIPYENIKIDIDTLQSEELLTDDLSVSIQIMTTTLISRPGETITIIALLSDEYNKVIMDKQAKFKLNEKWILDSQGKPLTATSVNGLLSFNYKLPYTITPGNYDVKVIFDEKGYKTTTAYVGLVIDKSHTYISVEPLFVDYGDSTVEVEAIIRDELNNTIACPVMISVILAGEEVTTLKAINGIVHTNLEIPNVTGILTLTLKILENDIYYESEVTTTINIGY